MHQELAGHGDECFDTKVWETDAKEGSINRLAFHWGSLDYSAQAKYLVVLSVEHFV
jgi:hypothetical protein